MQGRKHYSEKLFTHFQLSDRVPSYNFYRRLKAALDLGWLYGRTKKYYGRDGQKSIDPVVFFKLLLIGYFENLLSDRRIIDTASMRLDMLYFLGYDMDEELPWHSTLSRTRQLYGQKVFTQVFRNILKQCIDKGMLSGRRQAVDGVFVKANASLDSMIEREVLDDATHYRNELDENQEERKTPVADIKKGRPKDHDQLPPKKNPTNKTHYNPGDPDAKMSVKPGKATALNYLGQVSVDTSSHIITHIEAFPADQRDSQCLPSVIEKLVDNLSPNGIIIEEILADTGYSSGEALQALEDKNITGYIPNRRQFIYERPGFTYNSKDDYYICPNNKKLVYSGTHQAQEGVFNKEYKISRKICKECPLQQRCSAFGKYTTLIRETTDRPLYSRMHERMQTRKAKRLMKRRQATVEPVIGTLINYMGMKRVNTKGLEQANKCLTMSAVAYNIKKLLKHIPIQHWNTVMKLKQGFQAAFRCILINAKPHYSLKTILPL